MSAGSAVLDLHALAKAHVATEPFPYLALSKALDEVSLARVSRDFPAIRQPGVFPLSDLKFGEAFAGLVEEIRSPEFAALVGAKFDIDLAGRPMMITVRGQCQARDGRIHTDSKDKLVTGLLYLNDVGWRPQGGRLRLLRDGRDLESTITEIPPDGGNLVLFRRTENSWHGHEPFEGPRRYIMFNWLRSDAALAKNVSRHKLSAAFKRLGVGDGY